MVLVKAATAAALGNAAAALTREPFTRRGGLPSASGEPDVAAGARHVTDQSAQGGPIGPATGARPHA